MVFLSIAISSFCQDEDNPEKKEDKPYLGVKMKDVDEESKNELGFIGEHGVIITEIMEDTPAAKCGLEINDIITKINQDDITDSSMLREAIFARTPGDIVSITVYRKGANSKFEMKTLSANLIKLPDEMTMEESPEDKELQELMNKMSELTRKRIAGIVRQIHQSLPKKERLDNEVLDRLCQEVSQSASPGVSLSDEEIQKGIMESVLEDAPKGCDKDKCAKSITKILKELGEIAKTKDNCDQQQDDQDDSEE
jgi:membrane-associated protease RseP (regulator of RpoE activity)